jgi:hypothetical protein
MAPLLATTDKKRSSDLFVDRVIRKEPAQVRRLERDELIFDFLEHPLRVENM